MSTKTHTYIASYVVRGSEEIKGSANFLEI